MLQIGSHTGARVRQGLCKTIFALISNKYSYRNPEGTPQAGSSGLKSRVSDVVCSRLLNVESILFAGLFSPRDAED